MKPLAICYILSFFLIGIYIAYGNYTPLTLNTALAVVFMGFAGVIAFIEFTGD